MHNRDENQKTTLLEAFAICVAIAGTAVIIFATGRVAGVDIGRDEVSAHEHYQVVKDSALAACVDTDPTALRKCVIEAAETAQNQSEARQDLYAQQDMSRWAFWMTIISGLTMLMTGVGIVWIRDTLVETRRAVDSADDAVRVTREIGVAQISPYLSIVRASAFVDEQCGICFRVQVKNSGQTPAKNVHVIVSVWVNRPFTPPGNDVGDGTEASVEVFSRPLNLGDLPAQGMEESALHHTRNLSFPVDVVRNDDGVIQVGTGNIGVFGKDSFNNEVFEFGGVIVARGPEEYYQWQQTGNLGRSNNLRSFGNGNAMRSRGWSDYSYQRHQFPYEAEPVGNLD